MSPEAKATAAGLARLVAEIEEDRAGMRKRTADAEEALARLAVDRVDPGALALAGVALHGWYTGLETIFERIARELDGSVPIGDRWHRELISQMTAEIPGVRPHVIDPALVADLGALLGFRHIFRHAYAVSFDAGHLETELARLRAVQGKVDRALDDFVTFLRAAMATLAG